MSPELHCLKLAYCFLPLGKNKTKQKKLTQKCLWGRGVQPVLLSRRCSACCGLLELSEKLEVQLAAGISFGFLKAGRRTANISKVTKSQVFQVGSTKYVNLGINGLYQHESKLQKPVL